MSNLTENVEISKRLEIKTPTVTKTCRNGLNCSYHKRGQCKFHHPDVVILKWDENKKKCVVCRIASQEPNQDKICPSCEEIRKVIFGFKKQDERFYKSVVLVVTYKSRHWKT
jgi:hypothetical protein